ncbi:MAG TPA: tetratricopeptide repeat protein [Streptosporangiaceae bacterium]|jgi:tetratricopeptide (TPR) repeat protein|nr:tetratricopeptide repeat protein [Streptosporangiaceae bacterium]
MDDRVGVPRQELGEAYFLDLLGDAYNGLGRYDEAIVALSGAAMAFSQHGAQCAHAVCLFKIAQSHLAMAHSDQAIGYLEQCLPIFQDLHLPDHEAQALRALDSCRAALAS